MSETDAAQLPLAREANLVAQASPSTRAQSRLLNSAVAVFAITIFVGSSLLFLVQPMFAKLALPRLGGSPSVWNTCMLFFQTTLLLGYLYAHFSTRWLGVGRQVYLHLLVLIAPLATLPLTAGENRPPVADDPVWWLLRTMSITVGLPFFVVSTTAPLLQRWFATLPLASARDPYFLYSASNLGSMIALLGYPLLLEPTVGTRNQTWLWTAGYVVLAVLTAACAVVVLPWTTAHRPPALTPLAAAVPVSTRQRLKWVTLAFVPSSLLLGVTTHISTDIASVPLLWVLPLAMYLGTFVLAFHPREVLPHQRLIRVLPGPIFACLITILLSTTAWWVIPLHLVTFFLVALVCHRELALGRPEVQHLTEFYIWLSFGGMLGGVFNTLIGPQVFSTILEYPLVLALAAAIRPAPGFRPSKLELWKLFVLASIFVSILFGGLWLVGTVSPELGLREIMLASVLLFTAAAMFANRSQVFGAMAFVCVAVIAFDRPPQAGTLLFVGRSFFGVHRVFEGPDHTYRLLQHGSTNHGRQELPAGTTCEPSGYYHPLNPVGELFREAPGRFREVALVGLGTGALACYADSGSRWTFYEVDPLVEQIARDTRYFSYLENSAGQVDVVLGDGRISLQRALPGSYDLIVVDAFSSDAIPVHLLTREAVQLYMSRMKADGILTLHVSNRYLDLAPVVGALAHAEGLAGLAKLDLGISEEDTKTGRFASQWIVLARSSQSLDALRSLPGWQSPEVRKAVRPWTDDYSNILTVLSPK